MYQWGWSVSVMYQWGCSFFCSFRWTPCTSVSVMYQWGSVIYQWGCSYCLTPCLSMWCVCQCVLCISGDDNFFRSYRLTTCMSVSVMYQWDDHFFIPYRCTPSGWGSVPRVAVPARERRRVHPAAVSSRRHLRPPAAGPHGWERWGRKQIWIYKWLLAF